LYMNLKDWKMKTTILEGTDLNLDDEFAQRDATHFQNLPPKISKNYIQIRFCDPVLRGKLVHWYYTLKF
jgi:hypothetical protein